MMKDIRDVKKEYGYLLKWITGSSENGITVPTVFFLENVDTLERVWIRDYNGIKFSEAYDYICKVTVSGFRSKDAFVYAHYVKLFKLMGISCLKLKKI